MGKKNNKGVSIQGYLKAAEKVKLYYENAPNIRLTNGEMEGLLTLSTTKMLLDNKEEIPVRVRNMLANLVKEAAEKVKSFIQDRDAIYQEYCDRDPETNEPMMIPDGRGNRRYTFSTGAPGMNDKINELAEIEYEFSIKRIWLNKKVSKLLSGQDMLNVLPYADYEIPDEDD